MEISQRAKDTLDELTGYFDDEKATIAAIVDDSDKLDDAIYEIADGRVNVYHSARMEWAAENWSRVGELEGDAIANGAKTVSDIIAWCWHETESENIREDIEEIKNAQE